jgi:DNA (cytosine-5)-methyltransferase 1
MTTQRKKKPNTNRVGKLRDLLANDIFNQNVSWVDTAGIKPGRKQYLVADLFSGAGGMTLGFRTAGFEPVFSVELDPDASATYRRNFPKAFHYDDRIENLTDEAALEALRGRQVHVLCAGFPCQGFSVAGFRRPDDERNSLFLQFVRFARLFKPWFVVGENVPGVVTLDEGRFFRAILEEFSRAGYPNMAAQILESAEYGVAQFRPRAIFVGNRFGLPNPYPKPLLKEEEFTPIEAAIDDLKDAPRNPSINHEWTLHSEEMEQRISAITPGGSLYPHFVDAWKRQYRGVPSMTVKENHGGTHVHYELNRTISAREMARLQSFPDDFVFSGRMKRVMFQVGNAVPPQLARNIALALRPSLDQIAKMEPLSDKR